MSPVRKADLDAVPPVQSLKARIFETLRRGIVEGQLEGGGLYSVESLSKELNVSRTPVREALIDLAARGMVRFERNQGVRILQTSLEDLREILTLRLLLEVPAVYQAAELISDEELAELGALVEEMERLHRTGSSQQVLKADRGFHHRVMEIAGNQRLADYVDHLRDLMTLRGFYTADARHDLHLRLDEHRAIHSAMADHDPAAAADAARTHILGTGRDLLRHAGEPEGMIDWAHIMGVTGDPVTG